MDTVFEAVNCARVCVWVGVRPRLTGIRVLRQIDDTTEEERRRRRLEEFHYGSSTGERHKVLSFGAW